MHRTRLCHVVIHLRTMAVYLNRLTSIIKLIQDSHQSLWYSSEVVIVLTKRVRNITRTSSVRQTRSLNITIGIHLNGYGNYFHPIGTLSHFRCKYHHHKPFGIWSQE
jgi:hypothetical protein